jgi:flagellar motor switch protein FliM
MPRDHIRRLELTHETFQRAMGAQLSTLLRTMARVELLAIDQVTYDEYIRSMPNPTVVGMISLEPLPGEAMLEMSTSTALTLVDRLLGGIGKPGVMRRPTELESRLIQDLMREAQGALRETFEPLLDVEPRFEAIEFNPNFVQATNPSEMVVVMSYSLSIVEGARSEGLLTLCYPFSMLMPAWELAPDLDERPPALGPGAPDSHLKRHLPDISMPMAIRLRETAVSAAEIAQLQPGDVLRFDHKVDEGVLGVVAGLELVEGRIGRKGKNMALQVTNWRTE